MRTSDRLCIAAAVAACHLAMAHPSAGQDVESNLLVNASFEEADEVNPGMPAGWIAFSSKRLMMGLSASCAKTSDGCMELHTQGLADANQGLTQELPVTAGARYQFSAHARVPPGVEIKGTPYGQIVIEWRNVQGQEIARKWGPTWSKNTSKSRWEPLSVADKAPSDAVTARFSILFHDGRPAGNGTLAFDDVAVRVISK